MAPGPLPLLCLAWWGAGWSQPKQLPEEKLKGLCLCVSLPQGVPKTQDPGRNGASLGKQSLRQKQFNRSLLETLEETRKMDVRGEKESSSGSWGQLSPQELLLFPRPHNESFPAGRSAMKTSWLLWSLVPLSEDRGLHLPGPREKHHVRVRSQTCIWEPAAYFPLLLVCLWWTTTVANILALCPGISQFTLWSLRLPVPLSIHLPIFPPFFLPLISGCKHSSFLFPFIQPSLHLPIR